MEDEEQLVSVEGYRTAQLEYTAINLIGPEGVRRVEVIAVSSAAQSPDKLRQVAKMA